MTKLTKEEVGGPAVWPLALAKARLSELVAKTSEGPQHIMRNGKPAAVVISVEDWTEIKPRETLKEFLLDPSWRVLSREEVDTLFTRDRSPERPPPTFD